MAVEALVEAARADGDGAGFAVVADEVKTLAEETRESAAEISGRIEEIQAESKETVADVRTMEHRVSESVSTVEAALEEFTVADGDSTDLEPDRVVSQPQG